MWTAIKTGAKKIASDWMKNKAIDGQTDSGNNKNRIMIIILVAIIAVFLALIFMIVIIITIASPIFIFMQAVDGVETAVAAWGERLTNTVTLKCFFCTANDLQDKFDNKLKNLKTKYKSKLDYPVLLSTIYYQTDYETTTVTNSLPEKEIDGDSQSNDKEIANRITKLNKVSKAMLDNSHKKYDEDTFKKYLKETYIPNILLEGKSKLTSGQLDNMVEEIYAYANLYRDQITKDDCEYTGETDDYESWKQTDERWGNISLGSGGDSISSAGCLVTSIAIQMARSGTQIVNSNSFDPGVFVNTLNSNGGFSGSAFNWQKTWNSLAPNFEIGGQGEFSSSSNVASEISNILNEKVDGKYQKYLIVGDMTRPHWVAVKSVNGSSVEINDPAHEYKTLEEGGYNITRYAWFYATDEGTSSTTTSTSTSSGSSGGTSYSSSEYQDRLNSVDDLYNQASGEKTQGATIEGCSLASSGCLIGSLSGMVYMFTGNDSFSVQELSDDVTSAGGTAGCAGQASSIFSSDDDAPSLKDKWGIYGHSVDHDVNSVISELENGAKILISCHGGPFNPSNGGHYIMMDHYNKETNQIYIFNTGGRSSSGYYSPDEITDMVINYIGTGMWAIYDDNSVNINACKKGTTDFGDFADFVAYVEGSSSCDYNGSAGYVSQDEGDGIGNTTAFGITKYDEDAANQVGYSSFMNDLNSGCTSKEYVDKMFPVVLQTEIDAVTDDTSGISLQQFQIYTLASIRYNTGANGGYASILQALQGYGPDSFQLFNIFKSRGGRGEGSWTASSVYNNGLVRRRMAEYEAFMTGNFKAAKPSEDYDFFAAITDDAGRTEYMNRWPTYRSDDE